MLYFVCIQVPACQQDILVDMSHSCDILYHHSCWDRRCCSQLHTGQEDILWTKECAAYHIYHKMY